VVVICICLQRVSKAVYIVFAVMPNDQLCSSQERIIPIGGEISFIHL